MEKDIKKMELKYLNLNQEMEKQKNMIMMEF